jgi:hypothetical protein
MVDMAAAGGAAGELLVFLQEKQMIANKKT